MLGDLARLALALHRQQFIPGIGRRGKTEHHDRHRGRGLLHRNAILIEHRAYPAELATGDDRVTHAQRAALDQHRGDRAAALLHARLDDDAGGKSGARRTQLEHLDCSRIASSSWSMPWPVRAETGTNMFWPPHSSAMTSCLESSVRTRSWSASPLSILFTATTIGTPAARAWLIASMVCGMTPSSAATTSTTMSVARAPRARMAVKAAWPGVSRKVMTPLSVVTW